jgi:hypothetical protein
MQEIRSGQTVKRTIPAYFHRIAQLMGYNNFTTPLQGGQDQGWNSAFTGLFCFTII